MGRETTVTEYDPDRPGTETDWLANSAYGYGFGYTKEQALTAMAANVGSVDSPVKVNLVEHSGDATVGPGSVDVEVFVRQEVVKVDPDAFNDFRDVAIEVDTHATNVLENAETLETFEPDPDEEN